MSSFIARNGFRLLLFVVICVFCYMIQYSSILGESLFVTKELRLTTDSKTDSADETAKSPPDGGHDVVVELRKKTQHSPDYSSDKEQNSENHVSDMSKRNVNYKGFNANEYFSVDRTVKSVSCSKLFDSDKDELKLANQIRRSEEVDLTRQMKYFNAHESCHTFIKKRGYITSPLTELEARFPLAYSLLMYKDPEQAERLLRAIYRPQNIYCIHIDNKTDDDVFRKMQYVANCFDNVFITERRYNVRWGKMTVLLPEVLCMKEIWKRSTKWKYFINLTGQEFPLRTNYELVKILTVFNGSNDVEATRQRNHERWKNAGPVPYGAIPTKGALHITASKAFIDYILHDKRAHEVYHWSRKVKIPDEIFFSTLNHNPVLQAPGSFSGDDPETTPFWNNSKPYISRFKNRGRYVYDWACKGKWVRGICIFGVGDLKRLAKRREFFANKFHLDYHPLVLDCMEELIYNRTRDEYLGRLSFNTKWYSNLGYLKHKVS